MRIAFINRMRLRAESGELHCTPRQLASCHTRGADLSSSPSALRCLSPHFYEPCIRQVTLVNEFWNLDDPSYPYLPAPHCGFASRTEPEWFLSCDSSAKSCISAPSTCCWRIASNCETDKIPFAVWELPLFERKHSTHLRSYCVSLINSVIRRLKRKLPQDLYIYYKL